MSQTFKLFRLQQIDSQIDRVKARLKAIETALAEDEDYLRAQQTAQQARANLESAAKALRRTEADVNDQRLKIEQTESTLYGGKVRNPKELQDLQNEAAALKRYRSVLEDRQLEAMIALEEAEGENASAEAALAAAKTEFEQKNSSLTEEQSALQNEAGRLVSEREAAASTIPPEELALYEQLRSTRRGLAVAKVSDRSCAACGTMLNASLLHAARSPSQMSRCATCGRILYGG
jgi:uncharacterized protein